MYFCPRILYFISTFQKAKRLKFCVISTVKRYENINGNQSDQSMQNILFKPTGNLRAQFIYFILSCISAEFFGCDQEIDSPGKWQIHGPVLSNTVHNTQFTTITKMQNDMWLHASLVYRLLMHFVQIPMKSHTTLVC